MPTNDHYVILGNGPAGNHAAAKLREKDGDATVTILSDEAVPFYYKPKLTRYILDEIDVSELLVKQLSDYADQGIRVRLGQPVERIDPGANTVHLAQGETVQYTKLIIATGARQRILSSMAPYASCLQFVSSYDQAVACKEDIRRAESVLIFGGDLVGFKFVRLLTRMNKQVSLLIYPGAFWPFSLDDEMESVIEASLAGLNVDLIKKDGIENIIPAEKGYRVITRSGLEKRVDIVFSFNGLEPNVEFALDSGLDIDRGILVNEYMQTSHPDVYACGSCAQIFNPGIRAHTTSIGWANAVTQGELAALNLLGEHREVQWAGRKYFDLEGVKIKTTWWEDIDRG